MWFVCGPSHTLTVETVIHAEMPVHAPGVPEPRGLQLWVDLPKEFKMVEPSYQELGPEGCAISFALVEIFIDLLLRIPSAYPEGEDGGIQVKVISGKSHGVESPVRPLGGCWYFHLIFKKKGSIFQDLREHRPVKIQCHESDGLLASGWTAFLYSELFEGRIGILHPC